MQRPLRTLVGFAALCVLVPAGVLAAPQAKKTARPTETKTPRRRYVPPAKPQLTKKGAAAIKTPSLPRNRRVRPKSLKPLRKAEAERIHRDLGVQNPSRAGTPTTLTVRAPHAGSHATMTFTGAEWTNPAQAPVGVAVLGHNPRPRRSGTPSAASPGPRVGGAPADVRGPFDIELDNDVVFNVGLAVEFTARHSRDHVVECAWTSRNSGRTGSPLYPVTQPEDLYTRVSVGGRQLTGGTAVFGNRLLQFVPAQSMDAPVVVRMMAEKGFMASQCTITPFATTPPKHKRTPRTRYRKRRL